MDSRLNAFREIARLFLGSIRGDYNEHLPTFETGVVVQNVMQAVKRSVKRKSTVRVSDWIES